VKTGAREPPRRPTRRFPGRLDANEGFASLDCHVIVTQPAEVIEVAGDQHVEVDKTADRARAFARLVDEHLDAAYRLAQAILRDPSEARDATHDALIQAWGKWTTLRDPLLFTHWFDRILVNKCRNRLHRASRFQARDISAEVGLTSGDQFGRAADDHEVLGNALATLSPDHRMVVALRFYRDLQVEEIATRLGIPAGTVHSRLHYALKHLHRVIDAADAKGTI
jgi:RNA polymerase sigma-70 factor (ECF subfamily)